MLRIIKKITVQDDFISKNFDRQIGHRYLLETTDRQKVETSAYIHYLKRKPSNLAIDISTMIGCPVGCKFCATSPFQYKRLLTKDEIVSQVDHMINLHSCEEISEITCSFQGIGEPSIDFYRIENAIKTIKKLDTRIIISLSTTGYNINIYDKIVSNRIPLFSFQQSMCGLTQEKASFLMPNIGDINTIISKLKLLSKMNFINIVKLNYILIKNFNDTRKDMLILANNFANSDIYIKISSLNFTHNSIEKKLEQADLKTAENIRDFLLEKRVKCYCFGTFNDTKISCGQLAFEGKNE